MRRTAVAAVLTLLAATIQVLGAAPAQAAPGLPPDFTLQDYPTGQAAFKLTDFAWLADGGLLAIGKDGTITFVPPGGTPRFVTKVPTVRAVGDHGMLGLALANDYAATGHVYLAYDKGIPTGTGFGMVERWTASPPGNPTSFTQPRAVIDGSIPPLLNQKGVNHGLDTVLVAPDNTLFVSIGDDTGNNGDVQTLRAQDLTQPYGKLLHLTPDGKGVPSNPFYSAADPTSWRSRIYAYGLRNPFRLTLDPRSGVPQVGDVGWNTTEELNALAPGANGGWPCYEGTAQTTFSSQAVCKTLYAAGSVQMPLWSYQHAGAGASVTGGMFYTGTSYPEKYRNSHFFGDYARGQLWTIATDSGGAVTRVPEANGFAGEAGGPVAFHAGPNGDVTYADVITGNVRRLVYKPGNRDPVARFTTTTAPTTRTVSFTAADSYDLDGDAMTFSWAFGDGTGAQGVTTAHTYAADDPVNVTLTVTDKLGASSAVTDPVYPANHAPQLTLNPPLPGTYKVGDHVVLTATATDSEDGLLTVKWDTALLHCPFAGVCHQHPEDTVAGPTYDHAFTDHGADTTMLVTAHVEDSLGAVASTVVEAKPTLQTIAVNSSVPVTINGESVASAQVVAASNVQLKAPQTSGYMVFDKWSDGGAAAHSFTMPTLDRTLSTTYVSAIDKRYGVPATKSLLGSPTGVEYDVAGGRARNYVGGRLYWTPGVAVHEVHGPILTKYLAAGGPGGYGFPTTDVVPVTPPAGSYAHFSGGRSIFWSSATKAHLVYGAIRTKYAGMGYQKSCLRFPTTDRFSITGGFRNRFTGGTITWQNKTQSAVAKCS
jgi:glucose/arabinose dehydrogenase